MCQSPIRLWHVALRMPFQIGSSLIIHFSQAVQPSMSFANRIQAWDIWTDIKENGLLVKLRNCMYTHTFCYCHSILSIYQCLHKSTLKVADVHVGSFIYLHNCLNTCFLSSILKACLIKHCVFFCNIFIIYCIFIPGYSHTLGWLTWSFLWNIQTVQFEPLDWLKQLEQWYSSNQSLFGQGRHNSKTKLGPIWEALPHWALLSVKWPLRLPWCQFSSYTMFIIHSLITQLLVAVHSVHFIYFQK